MYGQIARIDMSGDSEATTNAARVTLEAKVKSLGYTSAVYATFKSDPTNHEDDNYYMVAGVDLGDSV